MMENNHLHSTTAPSPLAPESPNVLLQEHSNEQSASGTNVIQTGDLHAQGDINIILERSVSSVSEIDVQTEGYFAPGFTGEVLEMLRKERLVILYGNHAFKKQPFSRHVSSLLCSEMEAYKTLRIDFRIDDQKSLPEILVDKDSPSVFLVDDLLPLDLQGPIHFTTINAEKGQHYVIAISEKSPEFWNLSQAEMEQHWFRIPEQNLYAAATLVECLKAELDRADHSIDWGNDLDWRAGYLGKSRNIDDAATALGNPERIALFVHVLSRQRGEVNTARFWKVLTEIANSPDSIIHTWFHEASEKSRMLLVASSLFDGLFDYQFFLLTDELIQKRWKHRVPELEALDYCDLEEIHQFYEFEHTERHGLIHKGKDDKLTQEVLQQSVQPYRRHIQSAIPVIRDAVIGSVGKGNKAAPRRLRDHLSISLSNLGLYFPENVDEVLDEFADSSKTTLHRVAALAVAHWRALNSWDLLEQTVIRWLGKEESRKNDRLRQTALLALSYSADYDKHNQLHPQIVDWLRHLYQDGSDKIQEYLTGLLPKMVRNHPKQLAPMLKDDLLKARDQIQPVSEGLAQAMSYYAKEVRAILSEWLEETQEQRTGIGHKLTHRDRILLTVVWSLIKSKPDVRRQMFPGFQFPDMIIRMRAEETQSAVRAELLAAAFEAMKANPSNSEDHLKALFRDSGDDLEKLEWLTALQAFIAAGRNSGQVHFPIAEALGQLHAEESSAKIRMALADSALQSMAELDLNVFETLHDQCKFVEERQELLDWALGILNPIVPDSNAPEGVRYDPESFLALLTKLRGREFHHSLRGKLMRAVLFLMAEVETMEGHVLEQLMEDAIFEEKLNLLERYGNLLLDGRIPNSIQSLKTVDDILWTVNLFGRKQVFDVLGPILVKMAPQDKAFSLAGFKVFAQHLEIKGRTALARLIGQVYLDERARQSGGAFEIEVEGRTIPMFPKGRKLTAIESEMYTFIKSDQWRIRQLGILAFLEFARVLDGVEGEALRNPSMFVMTHHLVTDPRPALTPAMDVLAPQEKMQPIPLKPMLVPSKNRVRITDQFQSLGVWALIVGFLIALFKPSEMRTRFWLAVRTMLFAPGYGMRWIGIVIQRWQGSNDENVSNMARMAGTFFNWIKKK